MDSLKDLPYQKLAHFLNHDIENYLPKHVRRRLINHCNHHCLSILAQLNRHFRLLLLPQLPCACSERPVIKFCPGPPHQMSLRRPLTRQQATALFYLLHPCSRTVLYRSVRSLSMADSVGPPILSIYVAPVIRPSLHKIRPARIPYDA